MADTNHKYLALKAFRMYDNVVVTDLQNNNKYGYISQIYLNPADEIVFAVTIPGYDAETLKPVHTIELYHPCRLSKIV